MKQWQQNREPTPPSPAGPPPSQPLSAAAQSQKSLYAGGSMGRTTPVGTPQPPSPMPPPHVSYDPRWVMVPPFIDPRIIQGRPMDYYPPTAGVHPTGKQWQPKYSFTPACIQHHEHQCLCYYLCEFFFYFFLVVLYHIDSLGTRAGDLLTRSFSVSFYIPTIAIILIYISYLEGNCKSTH